MLRAVIWYLTMFLLLRAMMFNCLDSNYKKKTNYSDLTQITITNYKSQWSDVQLSGRVSDNRADRPILRSHQTWRLWWGEAEVWFYLIILCICKYSHYLIIVHLQIFALASHHMTCKHRRFTLTFRGLAFEFPAETKFQPSYGGSRRELGRLQFPPGY